MPSPIETYDQTLADTVLAGVRAEASALLEGIDPKVAADVGLSRTKKAVAPKHGGKCFLTEDRTVAVNAQGNRLPHNARGVVAPGSLTRRGKTRAQVRVFQHANTHAGYVDSVRRIMRELEGLLAHYARVSCRKRKALRGPIRAVHNKLHGELSRTL